MTMLEASTGMMCMMNSSREPRNWCRYIAMPTSHSRLSIATSSVMRTAKCISDMLVSLNPTLFCMKTDTRCNCWFTVIDTCKLAN